MKIKSQEALVRHAQTLDKARITAGDHCRVLFVVEAGKTDFRNLGRISNMWCANTGRSGLFRA